MEGSQFHVGAGGREIPERVPLKTDRITELREERGMLKNELARQARIEGKQLQRIESGRSRYVTKPVLGRLAGALGVDAGTLIDEEAPAARTPVTVNQLSVEPVQPAGLAFRRARLRALRTRRGFARGLGISPKQLQGLEKGAPTPAWLVARAAQTLGLEPLAVVVGEVTDEDVRRTLLSGGRTEIPPLSTVQ